jgi:SagB-type dehydrogenase family enzyme
MRAISLLAMIGSWLPIDGVVMRMPETPGMPGHEEIVRLPSPIRRGTMSLEEALQRRRSVREYADAPLSLAELSQLLWAAQGITDDEESLRTAPSAGALYPLEIVVVAGEVRDLTAGVYRYRPHEHALAAGAGGDRRPALARAALGQSCVRDGAAVIVIAAVYSRTTGKYGSRGRRYVEMEVGHAAQNISLEAVALGLGTVVVGAFEDDSVRAILEVPRDVRPLALLPVGRAQ